MSPAIFDFVFWIVVSMVKRDHRWWDWPVYIFWPLFVALFAFLIFCTSLGWISLPPGQTLESGEGLVRGMTGTSLMTWAMLGWARKSHEAG